MNDFFYRHFTAKQKIFFWLVFIFAYLWIIGRVLLVSMYEEGKIRDSIHGDAYSDVNTHSAVRYFYDFGFLNSSFLPVHQYAGNFNTHDLKAYTHYPALPDILAGGYAYLFQSTNEECLRIVPVLLSIGFFFLIFQTLWTVFKNIEMALWGGMILVCSNYFLFWADNLHKHLYEELLKWLYFWVLWNYYHTDSNKRYVWLSASFVIFLLVANISFEPITYLAVLTVGFSWMFKRKIICMETIVLAMGPILGFALHLWQNAMHLGSLELALLDLKDSASMRTSGGNFAANELHRSLNWKDYLSIPWLWLIRIERFFLIPGIAALVFSFYFIKYWKQQPQKNVLSLLAVLVLCTLSWSIFMSQHAIVHIFTTKHAGICMGLVCGGGIYHYRRRLLSDLKTGPLPIKIFHIALLAYILVMALSQQVWDFVRYSGWW
jgi:hypothetical protein